MVHIPLQVTPGTGYAVHASLADGLVRDRKAAGGALIIAPLTVGRLFPFDEKLSWTYQAGNSPEPVGVALHADGDPQDGTHILRHTTGYEEHFVHTAQGLFLSKILNPTASLELIFDPPMHLCPEQTVIGAVVRSTGIRSDTNADTTEPLKRSYQSEVLVEGAQNLKVTAGAFSTVKLRGTIITAGAPNILFTLWLAPGVGRVQSDTFGAQPLTLISFTPHTDAAGP